jgi:hypothetical protein
MMKTSISALLAFTGMLGDSNALKLTTMTQTTEPASVSSDTVPAGAEPTALPTYSPNRAVIDELRDFFIRTHDGGSDRLGNARMTYHEFASTMASYGFEPENHGCVEI